MKYLIRLLTLVFFISSSVLGMRISCPLKPCKQLFPSDQHNFTSSNITLHLHTVHGKFRRKAAAIKKNIFYKGGRYWWSCPQKTCFYTALPLRNKCHLFRNALLHLSTKKHAPCFYKKMKTYIKTGQWCS